MMLLKTGYGMRDTGKLAPSLFAHWFVDCTVTIDKTKQAHQAVLYTVH